MKIALYISLAVLLAVVIGGESYKYGWEKGAGDGYVAALDTVMKICDGQLKSDTSVTRLVMVCPDTNVVVLSRKTALLKKK